MTVHTADQEPFEIGGVRMFFVKDPDGSFPAARVAPMRCTAASRFEWDPSNDNVICPFAESDGVRLWKQFAPNDYAKAVGRVPMKRIGDVRADVGALVAFLLGSDATFITGQTIHVDGGIGCFR